MFVQEVVEQHHKEALALGHNVFVTGLQGSQNYGLAYEGSDVDTKVLVLPSFGSICRNRPLVSYTHIRENNEHVDVKDVRLMFHNFLKQNINMVEVLFTDYYCVDPLYADIWEDLRSNREMIASYDLGRGINCCAGMAMAKFKAMKHPYPSLIDKVEKYGYDPKQLYHVERMADFIERFFIKGESFESCLKPKAREYLLSLKTEPVSVMVADEIARTAMERISILKEGFSKRKVAVKQEAPEYLDSVVEKLFRRSFNMEDK